MAAKTLKCMLFGFLWLFVLLLSAPVNAQENGKQIHAVDTTKYTGSGTVMTSSLLNYQFSGSGSGLYNDCGQSVNTGGALLTWVFTRDCILDGTTFPLLLDPTKFSPQPTYLDGTKVSNSFQYFVLRLKFNTTSWQSLIPSNACVGINFIHLLHNSVGNESQYPGSYENYMVQPPYTADQLFDANPPPNGTNMGMILLYPTNSNPTGVCNTSYQRYGPGQPYVLNFSDSWYSDPYSCYFIFAIEQTNGPLPFNQPATTTLDPGHYGFYSYVVFFVNCTQPGVQGKSKPWPV
ncbi:MAG TPA: hypothetical protein VFA07_16615 [Chthonomonadaceae bacterium]|nr:hypothetical protein [Chthonomonadaceae bacterium]